MEASASMVKLCKVCSKLDIQGWTRPFYPCRKRLPCSTPPIENDDFPPLGSVDEIKSRRSACDICRLIAESLDKELPGLDGECFMREISEFCNFRLPGYVKAQDPSITHVHLTQASVIFDPSEAQQFIGAPLPWELEERHSRSSHHILNFQIKAKARSRVNAGKLTVPLPLMEQEFLDAIGGRCVMTQVDPQLIRAWLHQCESQHGENCMPSSQLLERDGELFQPTFVIDVIESCLVDTPLQCRYVALSYVWGTAPVFRHLLENTHNLRKAGSLRSLPIPSTIRDAITLVHAIGERYLWADSICIIQDDLKMQQAEITRMGSIYSRALFTVIAATGDHANSGLPGVKPESREQVQQILRLANCELLTVIDVRKTPRGIDRTIWAQRAWTFQERVVSNRVLVFSENQVYWSCRAASHSEERALEEVQDIDRHHLSFPQNPETDHLSWKPLQALDYCDIYCDLLSNYRQRHLTYQTDMLNAFNGISEVLAGIQNDKFLWGLPESLFSLAMTWFFTGQSARNYISIPVFDTNGSQEMTSIPSWSWAAWSGEIKNFLHALDNTNVRPVIHFDIVDGKRQLVRINERPWDPSDQPTLWKNEQSHPPGALTQRFWTSFANLRAIRGRTLWKNEQSHPPGALTQPSTLQIGHLHFWTSFANLKAIRGWRVKGPGDVQYTLFPPPDFQPNPNSTRYHTEIVNQDFIVIAAGGPKTLILLAIEWKGDVAYRVGKTEVPEKDWLQVKNRQWRSIILG